MRRPYRSWAGRREIVQAVIAQSNPRPLDTFRLTHGEETYYRSRAARAVDRLARQSSAFKAYYRLPTAKPFGLVVSVAALTSGTAAFAAAYLLLHRHGALPYPLLAACATVIVAAIGWVVAGWISHRNTIRQNTNTIMFARFSQAPFGEALHRFHRQFGWSIEEPVTSDHLNALRASGEEDEARAAAAAVYILNYFESIASGVLHGDLDQTIVRDNARGLICSYHDKCAPHIHARNRANPRTYENLIKLRTHYREP